MRLTAPSLRLLALLLLGLFPFAVPRVLAQPGTAAPATTPVQILGVTVEGASSEAVRGVVASVSGLRVGERLQLPGDAQLADAIRAIYRLGQFTDVRIVEERRVGEGVFLAIQVTESSRISDYTLRGVPSKDRDALRQRLPFVKGQRLLQNDLARAERVVEDFYHSRGYLAATATARSAPAQDGGLNVTIEVSRGDRLEVKDIQINGNTQVSDAAIRKRMKGTKEDAWWRLFGNQAFQAQKFEEDKRRVLTYLNEQGFYDARIVSDTAYVRTSGGKPDGVVVELTVAEGPRYHVRNVDWDGNTVYTDAQLTQALGLQKGDVFNTTRLQENLYGNRQQSDIAGLYMNRGYMRFNAEPVVRIAPGDSVDLSFEMYEGDVYSFGEIAVEGNDKTKEHVIRRELYTIPGQTFSRESVIESLRRLAQLNYFNQEALNQQPSQQVDDENKEVDLTYRVEEVGGDQLELSGTYGYIGLILQLRVTFNNFSAQNLFKKEAWRPLPMGDGQQLSLGVQTSGLAYQNFSLSFTEPWFRGKPTPIGFATSYSRYDFNRFNYLGSNSASDSAGFNGYAVGSVRGFFNRRLKWPDDKFDLATGVGYRYYYVTYESAGLPTGTNHETTAEVALSRNSQDHPLFPRSGSYVNLSLDVAPPIPGFIQYHKWGLRTAWNNPLANKLTFGLTTQHGYIGSFTSRDVEFQRFLLGGSPFDYSGINATFGKDIVFLRGYPAEALGPRRGDVAVGGRILNKYSAEVRWLAIQSPQLQAAPYLFADAANTWNGFSSFNPAQLYRSAGIGTRLFLPILGMIELAYGYSFDPFPALSASEDGRPKWRFQFSIGQGFNQ
ncbi:MAG TPA: outer membrane protein assembly factor BamA [Rhodothermales bacterium]|nr:outer membrane protein assembly factor BamA [Rhodothermales bacterium]